MLGFLLSRHRHPDPDLHRRQLRRLPLHPAAARRPDPAACRRARHRRRSATSSFSITTASTCRSVEQYVIYLGNSLHGDLGISIVTKKPVLDRVLHAVPGDPRTVALRHPPRRRHRRAGRGRSPRSGAAPCSTTALMATALVGYSMPIFWWALLLIIVFSGWLGLDAGLRAGSTSSTSSSRSPASC